MPSRPLAPDAVVINGKAEPLLLNGGHVVKSLSLAFLADLQEDWVAHGKDVFRVLRRSHPQAYFGGLVALAKMIRWETTEEMLSDGGMTPDEIMDKLEERVGPEGRKLFERFRQRVDDPERGIAERDSVLTSHLHPLLGTIHMRPTLSISDRLARSTSDALAAVSIANSRARGPPMGSVQSFSHIWFGLSGARHWLKRLMAPLICCSLSSSMFK